jgi:hypothetical protein
MRFPRLAFLVFFAFFAQFTFAQQTATSSPQVLLLLQRSLSALAGGQTLTDVTLSGTARRIAGSDDESGTVTAKALVTGEARIDLSLPSGTRSELRSLSNNCPVGSWSGPDGVAHPVSNHNLMTDSSWFFPPFTAARLVSSQTYVFSYVGQETRSAQTVLHVTASQPTTVTGLSTQQVALLQHLTQMDIFLDSATLLPAALSFNTHPDNDMGLDIVIEIRFSNYQTLNGVHVPLHVQKFLNNSLVLDLEIQSATFNTGLTASSFSL